MGTVVVKAKGPRGLAHVKVGKNKITVEFESGEIYAILPEDAPENITSGDFVVALNADKNQIYRVSPPKGAYVCKFKGFLRNKDKAFVIKDIPFQDFGKWRRPQHLEFYPVFEVVGKKCTGLEIVHSLYWVFKEHESGQIMITGTGMKKVVEFLEICGLDFDKDDTPYKDDPQALLQVYETLLLKKNKQIAVTLGQSDKGSVYVDSLAEMAE